MKSSLMCLILCEASIQPTMELYYYLQLALFFLSLFVFFLIYQIRKRKPSKSTGLRAYPLLGTLLQFLKNRHRFLDWTTELLSQSPTHTVTIQTPGMVTGVITANPANIEHVLRANFDNYPKGDHTITLMEDFLGHGIFNSDGDHWKWQRKAASFEFNKRSLRNFVVDAVQHEIVGRLLPLLARAGERGEIVDLQDVLERFAFDNICRVAFGEDPACLAGEGEAKMASDFMKAFGDAQIFVADRFRSPLSWAWKIKRLFNIGSERRLQDSVSIVQSFIMKIIQTRKERSSLDQSNDLLSRFASDQDNTDEFLRDIAINFILAGRETTSSALTWFFWLLSSRPDVEKKILEEVKSTRALNQNSGETFSFDELREMHYLHAAISESMRLYPPVPADSVSCRDDDIMPDGTFVGKGWFVTYSGYAMGRLEDIWGEDCRDYKPERWLEDGVFQPESPYRFPIFHAGPRMCLGKEMAYIQMKSIAACVIERFKIDTVAKNEEAEHVLSLTLRMKGGLQIRVRERKN